MSKSQTTTRWEVSISGNDKEGWRWSVKWREGSIDYGFAETFEFANKLVSDVLKRGEEPL